MTWRLQTQSAPPLRVQRTLAAYVRLPGKKPQPAWPREGQAAAEVEGVGSLGSVGGQRPAPIASVAKVMTAYLTLREHPLAPGEEGFVIRITRAEAREEEQRVALDQSTVEVRSGERISERKALEALMLPSANNIAALLAVHNAGGVSAFVARMNSTAAKLGMTSTTYTDPSGFNAATVSTAADQLKLARVAMRESAFAAIVAEPSARLPLAGRVPNYNGLVGANGYVGVKTGSDEAAGGCLVFAKRVAVGGRLLTVLGVVLGQRQGPLVEAALRSARRLGDSAAAALRVETALPAGTSALSASNAEGERIVAATAAPLREVGWGGLKLPVQVAVRRSMTGLRAGERVATVVVRGASTARTSAVATHPIGGPSLGWRLLHPI